MLLHIYSTSYAVDLSVVGPVINIEIEQINTNDRWSGQFTTEYIEEITHKAGNYKKFAVFVKMICSALNKTNESVFIDLLTFADLEALKQRKLGQNVSDNSSVMSNSSSTLNARSSMKRYVILTYSGEFDRVHYPLPLAFETSPNTDSLKRTINRLRKEILALTNSNIDGNTDLTKDAKYILEKLRQENTELRHRLRQAESRINKTNTTISSPPSTSSINPSLTEIIATNSKLRKQVESLKKDLADASIAYERLRNESTKEISKWKSRSGQGSSDPLEFYTKGVSNTNNSTVEVLRRRVIELEKEVTTMRKANVSTNRANTAYRSSSASKNSNMPYRQRSHTPPAAANLSKQPVSRSNQRSYSADSNKMTGTKNTNKRTTASATASSREARGRSTSPASSLGGRFDPTEYAKNRKEKIMEAKMNKNGVWGSTGGGSNDHRYERSSRGYKESGYSSATSQSSRGSRGSRGSQDSKGSRDGKGLKRKKEKKIDPAVVAAAARRHKEGKKGSKEDRLADFDYSVGIANSSRSYLSRKETADIMIGNEENLSNVTPSKLGIPVIKPSPSSIAKVTAAVQKASDSILRNSNSSISTAGSVGGSLSNKTNLLLSPTRSSNGSNSVRSSKEGPNEQSASKRNTPNLSHNSISEIDKRIQALQNYLDSARSGILSESKE